MSFGQDDLLWQYEVRHLNQEEYLRAYHARYGYPYGIPQTWKIYGSWGAIKRNGEYIYPEYIYGLYDPPERGGQLRYVGRTVQPLKRLSGHWSARNKGKGQQRSKAWINTLDDPPEMQILVHAERGEKANYIESRVIAAAIKEFGQDQILNDRVEYALE